MPKRPKQPCAYPGCNRLSDERYCEEHRKKVEHDYNKYTRDPVVKKKYGTQWRKIRERYVLKHPYCEQCLKEGRMTPVDEVHHKVPVSRGGTNDEVNLMSLCRSCHNKMHHDLGDR